MAQQIHSSEYEMLMQRFDSQTTLINAQFLAVNNQFDGVKDRLDKMNGKVGRHEGKIIELEKAKIEHVVNCPMAPKLRNIEDKLLENKITLDNKKFSFSKTTQMIILIVMISALATSITFGILNYVSS